MILRELFGYKVTQSLYVVAKLAVADVLNTNGPMNINDLAERVQADPDALNRVLRCLITLGFFSLENECYTLNDKAAVLVTENINSLRDFVILCGEVLYQTTAHLLYSVQTGFPAFNKDHNMDFWHYLNENPSQAKIFNDGMAKGSENLIREVLHHVDFSGASCIADVGGGKGHLICSILNKYSDVKGLNCDLEHAKASSLDFINKNHLQDRCEFIVCDFFQFAPKADIYLLKVILHDWNDEDAFRLLKTCHQYMPKGSRLIIIERIITDESLSVTSALTDINMLVTLGGEERSVAEFTQLLNKANFEIHSIKKTTIDFSIIEAKPI